MQINISKKKLKSKSSSNLQKIVMLICTILNINYESFKIIIILLIRYQFFCKIISMYTPAVIRTTMNNWKAAKLQGKYQILNLLGQGTFGKVYKARHKGEYFALKKLLQKNENFGISPYSLKQIKILRELNHPNIIRLIEVCQGFDSKLNKKQTYIVLELAQHDFKGILQSKRKCLIKQMLEGMHHIHSKNIVHRDIKNNNILYKNTGEVKIADFGCATWLTDSLKWSNIQNINYRAPQILLQCDYNEKIDIWSLGVVISKLLFKQFFLRFKQHQDDAKLVIEELFKICGTPSPQDWPEIYQKKQIKQKIFPKNLYKKTLIELAKEKIPNIDLYELDLLDKMLTINPSKRISTKQALQHQYFKVLPLPASLTQMPSFQREHQLMHQQKQKEKKVEEIGKIQLNKVQVTQITKKDSRISSIMDINLNMTTSKNQKKRSVQNFNLINYKNLMQQPIEIKKRNSSKQKMENKKFIKKEEIQIQKLTFSHVFSQQLKKSNIEEENNKHDQNMFEVSIQSTIRLKKSTLSPDIHKLTRSPRTPHFSPFCQFSPYKQTSLSNSRWMNQSFFNLNNQQNYTDKTSNYENNQELIQPPLRKKVHIQGQQLS